MRNCSMRDSTLRDLTLIKLAVACFVGIVSFIIMYSNGPTK